MDKIKDLINEKNQGAENNILETKYITKEDIPLNGEITKKYNKLAAKSHLGGQYDWLARFSYAEGIYDLELSIHVDDKAQGFIKEDVEKIEKHNDSYFKMKQEPSVQELDIFLYYHFPLLDMSKIDMEKKAKESGFDDIMEQTWFCFFPRKDGTPCGLCNPCKYTREEGMGRRVPDPTIKDKTEFFLRKVNQKVKSVVGGRK
ncbi:7-cyano-7-deazaguanine synthase [Natribacillus halophilus]|uniref:Queuosine biosynthesis protein QueC n=1 Tax=Natribacillus halophilus TaxID=549003 RepID=A0A1G8KF92_9BACI|nr:7-cyano-7-deazaguanine synthase [Natribacillus halophilus]SDI42091.1 Queuosine biosynthesis protein QueC [Natribacillus halophilus]